MQLEFYTIGTTPHNTNRVHVIVKNEGAVDVCTARGQTYFESGNSSWKATKSDYRTNGCRKCAAGLGKLGDEIGSVY